MQRTSANFEVGYALNAEHRDRRGALADSRTLRGVKGSCGKRRIDTGRRRNGGKHRLVADVLAALEVGCMQLFDQARPPARAGAHLIISNTCSKNASYLL